MLLKEEIPVTTGRNFKNNKSSEMCSGTDSALKPGMTPDCLRPSSDGLLNELIRWAPGERVWSVLLHNLA